MNTLQHHNIPQPSYYEEDEVTLKDIILAVKDYSKEVFKNLHWIVLTIILALGGAYFIKKLEPITYTSDISFIVQEDKDEITILNEQPILRGKRSSGNPNKLQQLALSSVVTNQILLETVTIENKKDFFANHIIDIYGFQTRWNKEQLEEDYEELSLVDFNFTHNTFTNFSVREHRALQILRDFVKTIFSINTGDYSEINKIIVTSIDDKISFQLRDLMFKALKDLYIENTVGRTQRNYKLLTMKVDSLETKFRISQRQLATATDQTYGLISKSSFLRKSQLQEEADRLGKIFQTFQEEQQDVEFNLKSKTPDFMVIDQTFLPIKNETSTLKSILIGAFLGLFAGLGFIIFRKIVRDALAA